MLVAPRVDHPATPEAKSRRGLALFAVVTLLLAGFIAWSVSSNRKARATATVAHPLPAYDARLQLSAEHLEALHPVVSTATVDMNRIRRELRSQLTATVRDLNATIAQDLSPERRPPVQSPPSAPERKPTP